MSVGHIVELGVAILTFLGLIYGGVRFTINVIRRLDQLLAKVAVLDEVKASADVAADEWRGATEAVREMADGHGRQLTAHDARITDLERRMNTVEQEIHA